MKNNDLGNRMKEYEKPTINRKIFRGNPLIVRIDGNCFHSFTKGLDKPFDVNLSNIMIITTMELVKKFSAVIGYTQSDEITLIWYYDSWSKSEYPFGGYLQKIESLIASYTTIIFNKNLVSYLPKKTNLNPIFDCRAFSVPNKTEAINCLIWRQQDAVRNAISSAAFAYFSHKSLQNLNITQMQEKLFSEKGINFNDYPDYFKRGTFIRKKLEYIHDEINLKPIYEISNYWLTKIENLESVIFEMKDPIFK